MQTCRLCGAYNPHERPGRLGRYALTCDRCEAARGSHLNGKEAQPAGAKK